MDITVKDGKTLLVDGPASVTLVSGKVEVFGFPMEHAYKVIIRDGKRMPFTVEETATFNISLGENSCVEELEGSTIPPSWSKAYEELLAVPSKPAVALVFGASDSGKTSFCTYLLNKLLGEKRRVAILDADLGQSDIGPPCTIAYTFVSKPVTDLFNLLVKNAFFVGVTSPSKAVDKVLQGLTLLKEEIFNNSPDFIVVNTDGWVEGEDAVQYKVQLAERISPNIIFCIQQNDKLNPLLAALKNYRTFTIDSPPAIKQRSREKRKSLRELGYIKYLKNAKVQCIPLNWVKIENFEQAGLGKNAATPTSGGKNLLVGLYDGEERFLGIGIIREIDYVRKIMKVFTPVINGVSTIVVGRVRLDKNFKEIPPMPIEEKR
ncbi:MAG: Clp1/GlmU family protein [Nitrososphaerota archaeon]|nr:Clp1/GlmU family protein [Candidatus Bathyarchaeota archaeon]MDW8022165.1 Clp1/GlmU family protein [Nitrososphaerota archaeon]